MIRVPDMPDIRRLAIVDGQVQPSNIGGYVFYIDLLNRMSVLSAVIKSGNEKLKQLQRENRRLAEKCDEQLEACRVLNDTVLSVENRHQTRIKELEAQVSRLQDSLELRIAKDSFCLDRESYDRQYQPGIAIDGRGNYS